VYAWLPPDVELMTDVSEADWVVLRLRPWDQEGVRVESFMPAVFDSYARLEHGRDPIDGGSAPRRMLEALVSRLSASTEHPGPCWFCLWDGWGTWWKGAHAVTRSRSGPRGSRGERKELRKAIQQEERIDDQRDAVLRRTPRVRTQHRDYFLVRGPLQAVFPLSEVAGHESPNLWWPTDRSWLVSTEIDDGVTYVGGSKELVGALLASTALHAVEASVADPLHPRSHRPEAP